MDEQQTLISNLQYKNGELVKQLAEAEAKHQRDLSNAKTSYNQKLEFIANEFERIRSDIDLLISDDNTIEELTASFDEIEGTDEESINKKLQLLQEIVSNYEEELIKKNDENAALTQALSSLENVTTSNFPTVYLKELSGNTLYGGKENKITATGSFFTPNIKISIPYCEVSNIEFNSDNQISFTVIPEIRTIGNLSITFNNGNSVTYENKFNVVVDNANIIDLRIYNQDVGKHIILKNGMDFVQNEQGIYFTGADPWVSAVKVPGYQNSLVWDRSEKRKISFIFKNTSGSFMVGIGSIDSEINTDKQYRQGECLAYFSSQHTFWGIYGNTGTLGSLKTQKNYYDKLNSADIKKITFHNNGEPGSLCELSVLPSDHINGWTSNDHVVHRFNISETLGMATDKLACYAIPRNGDKTIFIGIIFE